MRRKRFLANVGIVAATVAILPATIAVLWACGWYSGVSGAGAAEAEGGVTVGYVWEADTEASTLHVSANPLGIGAVPYTVTRETRVVVGDKEGGFGDLHEGSSVRITYERRDEILVARCVESLTSAEDDAVGGCPPDSLAHIPR